MGLFDFFKKKPPTHEYKVDLAYKTYRQDMVEMVFHGGREQASNIVVSLACLFNLNLDDCSAQQYHAILSIFSDVVIRRTIVPMEDENILISLQVKHKEYVNDKAIAEKVLSFCKISMSDPTFVINNPDKKALLEECSEKVSEDEQLSVQNISIQEASIDDADYGLCMTKPVYTNNTDDAERFLNTLKSTLGETLTWDRLETLDVEGIAGKVVVYNSYLPSGKSYKTVYVNEHGINAETRIPRGFTIEKSKAVTNNSEKEECYYFENTKEFATYAKICDKNSNVIWVSSDKYIELYQKGYRLFECGQYAKAIEVYKECLKLNPIGISARFELVECYVVLKQLSFARKSLYEMKDFLVDNEEKARFYRRVGYIAIEEGSYKEAYACYQHSLNFENHPSVFQEMQYIESKAGRLVKRVEAEATLIEHRIPLL